MEYQKRCEFCDKKFTTSRKHAKTCSDYCKLRLWKGGFSNSKKMKLIATFVNENDASAFQKTLSHGVYNFCKEASGTCYIYRYTELGAKEIEEKNGKLPKCKNVSSGDCKV